MSRLKALKKKFLKKSILRHRIALSHRLQQEKIAKLLSYIPQLLFEAFEKQDDRLAFIDAIAGDLVFIIKENEKAHIQATATKEVVTDDNTEEVKSANETS